MMPRLILADPAFSTWSLRAWLCFQRFGVEAEIEWIAAEGPSIAEAVSQHIPARTAPVLVLDCGTVVWDSLALVEEIAQRHPAAGLWPDDPADRAVARSLAAEMHSGFFGLRGECPMNLHRIYDGYAPPEDVRTDLKRLEFLWSFALERSGGPWLCGAYSAADAFFAPVAARIVTYKLPVSAVAAGYVARHVQDPTFVAMHREAVAMGGRKPAYDKDLPNTVWEPGAGV